MMEYITPDNLLTAAIALLMVRYLARLVNSDIGDSNAWNMMALVTLGVGLYLWRSGNGVEIVEYLRTNITQV